MSRSVCDNVPDEGYSQKRKVSNQIENLVADKLIVESKARFIDDSVIRQHNGVVQGASFAEPSSPQCLDLIQKPKRPGLGNLTLKRIGGAIVRIGLCLNQRMFIVNGVGNSRS